MHKLDIYDLGQSFGVLVLCSATENAALLNCLAGLAAASLSSLSDSTNASAAHTQQRLSQLGSAPDPKPQVDSGVDLETQVLCYALSRTRSAIRTSIGRPFQSSPERDTWQDLLKSSGPLGLLAPVYYLILRQGK